MIAQIAYPKCYMWANLAHDASKTFGMVMYSKIPFRFMRILQPQTTLYFNKESVI